MIYRFVVDGSEKRVIILLVDKKALVAELVDVVDLGSTALRCVGSSPTGGKTTKSQTFFIYTHKPVTPHVHNTPNILNISFISQTSLLTLLVAFQEC